MRTLLILGAGGHGKVCKEVAEAMGVKAWHEYLGMLNVMLGIPDF